MRTPLFFLLASLLSVPALQAADKVDYVKDVLPILETYCIGCHNQDDAEGDFAMDSHAALMRGGESGIAITQGESQSSRMLLMVAGKVDPKMPPEDEVQPSEDEVSLLTAWIDQGAAGPEGKLPFKRTLRTPKIASDADGHWPITAVATSPSGELRAEARYAEVAIEDADGKPVATITTEHGKINSLAFSRDGSRLLIGSGVTGSYGSATVYATRTGQLQSEMIGHRDVLYAAVFSPDESIIATAGYDRVIKLWDSDTGEMMRELKGHNGAIFDLVFSPDGKVLVSGCADETVKVWSVASGQRLDTLGQPEGEVFAVDITNDGKFVIAGSADNRLRVWRLRSIDKPRTNPIVATRFVDESPLVAMDLSPDGTSLLVVSQGGNVKVIRTSDWSQAAVLAPLPDTASDITIDAKSNVALIAMMNGQIARRELPQGTAEKSIVADAVEPLYLDLGALGNLKESELRKQLADKMMSSDETVHVGRGVTIDGVIGQPGESDRFTWQASAGEVWAIDADGAKDSMIDPIVTILDAAGDPVLKIRLQAVRDSYFTFRGKDSKQVGDFRVFNWQEMNLKQYFYANGEVTRLWMHPRGPDSGFNVYPGEGNRWTYFGTTNTTHALGEPAYIVQPLAPGEEPVANGLPVFDIYYENDDDPMRISSTGSRVLFTAPSDGLFTARITDTRGDGGEAFGYQLAIRPAKPTFVPTVVPIKGSLRPGTGREFTVRVDRTDGYDGPVTFDVVDLPSSVKANTPLVIEPGQRYATGTLWIGKDGEKWDGEIEPEVVAWATINGQKVERRVGKIGGLTLGEHPSVIPRIMPTDRDTKPTEDWVLQVRRGETASARLVIDRKKGFDKEVSFGKELSGRNTSAGVYVDNIGLNGLIVLKNANERVFYLTADVSADPGKRSFFLTAKVDGNVTSHPITVEVLP
ncbi:c-type cytochrome domain-containing protein [Planctomycetes bacterium K23_9]|uniref:WD domain, G-beta repeat n=1 Tax=Stieleria marina TaxID=1930275 RepID=A0A517NYL2_9BACT|nr:WD domain, G-beta repeat [Planctomycetes bacterium K23_9]